MKVRHAVAFFILLFGLPVLSAAATPPPGASGQAAMPQIKLPAVPLHSEYLVEVNKKGQVVKSKPSKLSKVQTFNLMTYGNTLQMWIRKPDGSATVGTFRVSFDYDPKSKKVARNIALVSEGGNWGAEDGAATAMYETAEKQLQAALKKQQQQNEGLPSLNQIRGQSPAPSPSPH
ncbi:MAG TPA: hypothetical protein VFE36_03050 [Candidatus Baltobacteraceae bacterium]|jgi:hypothetical protein|nr:hypothetical protein [Candidatus Baltobacteraceae bacterium]